MSVVFKRPAGISGKRHYGGRQGEETELEAGMLKAQHRIVAKGVADAAQISLEVREYAVRMQKQIDAEKGNALLI